MSVASPPTRHSGQGSFAEAEFDLPSLGAALWRQKWKIIRPTLLAALVALGAVQLITPKYLGESRILVEGRDNIFLRPEADKDQMDRNAAADPEAVTSQVQLVLSRDLAREVIDKLKLGERPEFDPALNGISPIKAVLGMLGLIKNPLSMTPEERVLDAYYDRLQVFAVEKSRVIVIDFLSEDPTLAAQVANAIADAYLMRQQAAKQEQARAAGEWLASQIETMRKKVADAEAKVEAFRAKSNLLVGPNNTTLSAQSLGDLNAQLAAARAQKADAEAKARLIRDMLKSGAPIESSDVLNSELIRRLSEQRVTLRAQLAEQSTTLLDGHPRIKELKAQIADLDQQIRAEAETIARALENDAKLAGARMDTLTQSLDQLKVQAAGTNEQDVELRALERDAKSQRDLLESYLAKYREATARDTLNSAPAGARVISRATVSNIPAYPKKLPTVLIAALAVMVLSSGFVLTRELLSAPVVPVAQRGGSAAVAPGTPAAAAEPAPAAGGTDATSALEARVAAITRRAPAASGSAGAVEAIEDVAEDLSHMRGGGLFAVLGAAHGLETAATAIKLARLLAETKARVVLVGLGAGDAALKAISAAPDAAGLAELAAGAASFADVISKDKHSAVNVIAAGHAGADREDLLFSPVMETIFAALSRSYDYVVIDGGAAFGPDEMQALGEIAPHALLITDALSASVTAAARDRLIFAGFDEVMLVAGARQADEAAAA